MRRVFGRKHVLQHFLGETAAHWMQKGKKIGRLDHGIGLSGRGAQTWRVFSTKHWVKLYSVKPWLPTASHADALKKWKPSKPQVEHAVTRKLENRTIQEAAPGVAGWRTTEIPQCESVSPTQAWKPGLLCTSHPLTSRPPGSRWGETLKALSNQIKQWNCSWWPRMEFSVGDKKPISGPDISACASARCHRSGATSPRIAGVPSGIEVFPGPISKIPFLLINFSLVLCNYKMLPYKILCFL